MTTVSRTLRPTADALVVGAAAVLLGAAAIHHATVAAAALGAICLVTFAVLVPHSRELLTLSAVAGAAVLVTQASQGNVASSWKLTGHVITLAGLIPLYRYARGLPAHIRSAAVVGLGLMVLSALAGAGGGFGRLADGLTAIWQDARWLGAIGIGMVLAVSLGQRAPRWAFLWLLALNATNLVISIVQMTGSGLPTRFGLPVPPGMFGHPTISSAGAVVLLLFITVERRHIPPQEWLIGALIAVLDIVVCTRLKTLLGFGAAMLILALLRVGMRPAVLAVIATVAPLLILFALVHYTPATGSYDPSSTSGASTIYGHAAPRVELVRAAERIAKADAPLGSGLASFGSYVNSQRELETYEQAGMAGVYGFRPSETFTSDNFVAHVLAERGYAGLLSWLGAMAVLIYCALLMSTSCGVFPAAALIASMALCPVSPSFRDGAQILLLFVPAGMLLLRGDRMRRLGPRTLASPGALPAAHEARAFPGAPVPTSLPCRGGA